MRGLALPLLLVVAGCADRRAAREFAVRGRVVALPAAGGGAGELQVQHEAIDDFVDREGEVVGMDPMAMSFPLAERASIAGIEVGDPIAFTLRVDWEAENPVEITRVSELPPGTELDFRAAEPGS